MLVRFLMLAYVVSAHMLCTHRHSVKICSWVLGLYVSKFPCGAGTRRNWKCKPERVSYDIRRRMCGCCLYSVCNPVTFCQWAEVILIIIKYVITVLSVLHWRGEEWKGSK
jgi:uncharacterized membrane protein